ncbi:hypothetical protein DMN91_004803 [Ooceraea biroi]|uniref:Microtubule-associated protein futsch n=1 Tax=Ooceraea biroi TaxID=2015173 RepID=A0A3L8DQ17_OOCBI|nr:microtubule-associated protein futsch [Ooceraea biroi]XP_011340267.2 microtubule-associated protein futsch [Ooceraea biroi]RLU22525.1 hypothetical protein DMN91_004803 [Ooceraea biroi]
MSATDPTGEGGGGGGGGESAMMTNVDQNASPSTPITGTAVPMQAAVQQQQQQQQHPPPSPLSGCYLLVVLPEPHTAQHKDLILNRLAKGFLSWDKDSCHVDLEKELLALVAQAPEGEEARNGERLIQYATENLVTEVLIHPQTNTLLQCIRNLLASFTKHRHIIHAGYTFGGNGSWILQDGTFSLADFLDAFSEHEVQRVLRAYENSVTVDIHCAGVGDWTTSRLSKEACCRSCRVRVNPDDVLTAGMPAITSFTNYIGQYLVSQTLDQLMEPSDVVGNIRFSHPTLYVFPGGQGDAALFGINGFNMLVDGGFARKACFWDFTRHLDRLDAVLVTRINNSNIGGMFSVLRKKKEMHVYPQIGHFFCNLVERRQSNSPDGDKDIDPLILNLTDIGQEMVLNLRHINLRVHPCYRNPDPINLYHKVGHGTLDMYVLSPSKDSREVREFLTKWHSSDSKLFAGSHKKDSNNLTFPIQNLVSICALLVWKPANPEDNITRILFPGSTPQHKIFEGFGRLKHLDFLKHPVCSAKTLSPSASLTTLRDKPTKQKLSLIEKESKKISEPRKERKEPLEPKSMKTADEAVPKATPQSTPIIPISKPKAEPKAKKVVENKKIDSETKESKKIEKELKEVKKESKKEPAKIEKVEKSEKREDDIKKTDLIKAELEKTAPKEPKEPKPKPEPKKKEAKEGKTTVKAEVKKSEVTAKQKPSEKRAKLSGAEKKDAVKSSPTTPKKTLNGTATKMEISKTMPKAKPMAKAVSSLPAKSAKEANNRKVVEQKKSEVEKSAAKDTAAPIVKVSAKPKPIDRKPISRRTKPVSPSKARMPGSPAKSTRSTPTASVKSDKDGVIRKAKGDKGTTDSSTVSTPSGIEPEVVKPIDKSLIEQSEDISLDSIESKVLADLKEEREVVEEIEAVLQKAERIEETRKDDRFEGDDEITAEATDKKEEDITEEDVTAEIEDVPKKDGSRKESQELTEEDEYLIVEKEEVYTEDSAQSGEGEQKHVLDEAESEKAKILKDVEAMKEKGEKEEPEKGKDDSPEKKVEKIADKGEKGIVGLSMEHKEQLQEEVKEIIASAAEIVQKTEEKDDSGKKDSDDTKEPSSLSPDKLDSSEKKTTDTDMKPDVDQKEYILEKMEEANSQERISTIESGATTTAPTLPEDERIPLDEIKEDIDEKHVIEEVKEKDAPAKPKEEVVSEVIPAVAKPDVKVFDVRQPMQNLQRDIVKTPDEVADLPVHEEVDPKLYRMEDFEKGKEEKPSSTQQEMKELPTPPIKEQKGVFSFFGKVADKFEKGIDKLTKKTKKDSDKDSDEKSSKSSSPKEARVPEKTGFEEVDMEKMFPKVSKPTETFEEVKPTVADVKVAAIKETAAFIQEEILDAKRQSVPDIEKKLLTDKPEEIKKVTIGTEEILPAKDISPAILSPMKLIADKEIVPEIESLKEEDIGEEAEEVKALLEEASKKFKTVKDSLRDSLESLEDKIKEEDLVVHDVPSALKDVVKDTLEGVAEKLEVIKPHTESFSPDIKEPEKVKFDIPKDEELEEEYEEEPVGPYRDMKEAMRDVGEVLAGTAGIDLEDKHKKDVTEIVKKVAEVLKEDDFLSDKVLFPDASKKEEISPVSTERKPSVSSGKVSPEKFIEEKELKLHEDIAKKVGVTEEFPVHEEIEELIQKPGEPMAPYEKPDAVEVKEELCVKVIKKEEDIVTSPKKDAKKDKKDAQKICAEMLKDDQHICDQHKKPIDVDTSRVDVLQAGIESVCVKEVAKRPSFEEKLSEDEIEHPVIGFEQKVSPAKAEIVMVTPGSTPTSPKFSTDKMYDQELEIGFRETPKLPEDIKQIISKEAPVEEIIEELIITKKKKITVEVIEYITVVKRIPRERVIYIIEEIIVKRGLAKESVVDDLEILELKDIMPEKRTEVEEYIVNEYIVKGKRITIEVVEEISIKKVVPKKIVIEIIEEIIVKKKIARHMVLDIPEEVLLEIIKEESSEESPEESAEEQITPKIDVTLKQKPTDKVPSTEIKEPISTEKETEIEEFIINEYINKGKRITTSIIDEISTKKAIPKKILIEIIEEVIIKKKIPRTIVLDVTEQEILAISKETLDDEEEKEITLQQRVEIEEYIVNEYVTKGDSITIQKLEEICMKKKVPRRIIIEIIEEIIIKRKIPKHAVLNITEEELSHIIEKKATPEPEIPDEKRKSIAEVASFADEKKPPVELKKKEIFEHEVEEELPAAVEEEDVEEEVDGFVSIPRRISDDRVDAKKKALSPVRTAISPAAKEHEKDVIDDFEAVEQEYKVRDVPVTSPEKADEMREKEDTDEAAEDTTSEVIEADEKFVQETRGKIGKEEPEVSVAKDAKPVDKKRESEEPEISDVSEVVDTIEKYLDEDKEKTDILPKESIAKSISPVLDKTAESLKKTDELKELKEKAEESEFTTKVAEVMKLETKLADATGFAQEPKVELFKDDKKTKDVAEIKITPETKEKVSQEMPEEALRKKRSISKELEDELSKPGDKPHIEAVKFTETVKDEKLTIDKPVKIDDDIGTVKRMLVTASSEDGREETEICPTGSITFTKIVTPEDSLKDGSVKSTPDKDSLLDKDSLHSGVSSPEKDSISEKSVPEGKDKITPEDSLEKSPGPRDSQDLEDSLEKSMSRKSKEAPSIDDDKPKVPGKSEDITKPKPEDKQEELSAEKIEKPKSPFDTEDVPVESVEKPKLPIEKMLLEPEKEGMPGIPKTPESLHSEDISPAETIFSKSPTDKSDMYFAKMPISEEKVPLEAVTEKLPIKETKQDTDKELLISPKKESSPGSKDDQKSETLETKESSPKPTSPIIATSAVDEKTLDIAPSEKSRSPSMSSEKHDEKDSLSSTTSEKSEDKESVRSKSPSITGDKPEQVDLLAQPGEKLRSSSIVSVKAEEMKLSEPEDKITEKSRSPSIATEKVSEGGVEDKRTSIEKDTIELLDKSRSSSIISDKGEKEDKSPIDKSRSSSIVSEPIDKDIPERRKSSIMTGEVEDDKSIEKDLMDKLKSSDIEKSYTDMKSPDKTSDIDKEKEIDKPKLPSDEKDISKKPPIFESERYDEKGPIDEARSPSAISDKSDGKKESDRSKSPSIAADKPDFQDVTEHYLEKAKSPIFDRPESPKVIDKTEEPQDKNRYPSVASDKSDSKGVSDRSRSPTISIEKVDLKDIDLSVEKARSPSVTSDVEDDKAKQLPLSKSLTDKVEVSKDELKSPKLDDDKTDLKDVTQPPQDKSRSSSIASTVSESKESLKEKSPVTTDKAEEFHDKSKLPSSVEQKLDVESKKSRSPSITGEQHAPGSTGLTQEPIKTSRSSSVSSIVTDKKEPTDRSKSPSIADEKDLKDIAEQPLDKSRSSSIVSATGDKKEPADRSKSPSIAEEKLDLKDVVEQFDDKSRSKSPVIPGKKDEHERSKSPSVASEKSEEVKSAISSKPPSISGDIADLKDLSEPAIDKSRSSSVTSAITDQKELIEKPVSPTIPCKAEEPHDRSKSPSMASEKSDEKKSVDGSRTASITEERPDLKDVMEAPFDKSRSSSVTGFTTEKTEPFGKSMSPTVSDKLEPPVDRSRSSSIASDKPEEKALDDKGSRKEYYEDIVDKFPGFSDMEMWDKKDVEERPSTVPGKLDIKSDDVSQPHDKSHSPSIVLDKPIDDEQLIETIDIDGLKTSSESSFIERRSLSIISDKTEPKSPSDASKSPSSADDKFDQKDKSRSSSIASEKLDDITDTKSPLAKEERAVSPEFRSLDTRKISKDESAKSSRASSPMDKVPDRSRSQSVYDIGEKTPASRSRTASLFDDKLPEKLLSQEEMDASKHIDMEKKLDEKDEHKSPSKVKSPITSPEAIQKEMQKIREKRFADFEESYAVQPSKTEKSDDEEEDIIKVTAEKKAEIEKYILEEFITKKKKISLVIIEKLVMTYSVPQFVVMQIIEDIISRENMPRSAVFDFVDEESSEVELKTEITSQQRADIEKYITEEFIAKKKKITPELLEEMIILKGVPRNIFITIIEEIIVKKQIPKNTVIEGDLEKSREKSPDKQATSTLPTSTDLGRSSITQEYLHGHEKPSDSRKSESPHGKVSPVGSDRYDRDARALSASPSFSPEPIPSDKSTQDSPARSEPHIDDEILISEEKRMEIEKFLEEEYIKKGKKITEVILEEIIIKTSLPRYIILEIVEEIILKKKIPRETVIDVEIYQEDEPEEDYEKAAYHYDRTTEVGYELPHDVRKSSVEYGMEMYPKSDEQQLDKSVTDYPDYESQFHKAFVGGMTEMRTTHITTLSGKSTPEFATHDVPSGFRSEPADKASDKLPERTLTTTHITTTDVRDLESMQPVQTVTILRESKIAEPHLPAESLGKDDKTTAVAEEDKRETEHDKPAISKEESEAVDTKQSSTKQDEPEAITNIIKRQNVEHDEPEVVTNVVKREIIEQGEPEVITKVIRREVVLPEEETSDSKEDSGEYVKTITTRTTRTIVTEELPDVELSQTDPSKIYKDPTSSATYRIVSGDSAPDAASADVKRIVTTVTTITGPDGKVTTKKDVKESTDTVESEELLEKLIDSDKVTTETTKSAEKIIKETVTSVTSGTSSPDMKAFYDSGKSTPDFKQEDKMETTSKEHLGADKFEHSISPMVRDLMSDDKSYSGKSSPDISLPKDIVFSGSTGKSTPEIPMSPLIRDGAVVQPHVSGRSTPDRRSDGRSSGTPEGFRSGEMIRTIITTTKTISDEGEIVTTTSEVTETTNEKGETIVLAEKTDVKVDERLPSKDAAESAISSIIGSIKSSELQRSDSPRSDDGTSEKDRDLTSSASEQSSVRSKPATHAWGSEERHTYSDDEQPSSPLSSTSQLGYSPQATRRFESDKEDEQKQVEFSTAAMSSSFYGELPAVPPQISAMKTFHGETGMQKSSDPIPIHSRFMVEKEFAGGYGEKPDAKKYIDEADLDFDKALMDKEMKETSGAFSSGISPRYTNGSLRHETDDAKDHPSSSFRDDSKDESKGDSKKDPLEGWGPPLELPSPKPPRKFNLKNPAQPSCSSESTPDTLNFDVLKDWGEPLRLPSPAPVTNEVSNKGAPSTPKKERKQTKKVQSENIKNKKRSESPGKNEKKMKDSKNKVQPVYMDLAYVPHHGNSYYTSLEFFKRVRARYYVFSGTEPSREVYDALLEAKKTWEDKDLEVTMIPTYDTDTLGYWVADNEEALAANHIDLSPSASRCTINLQDHETSCSAYRLEF